MKNYFYLLLFLTSNLFCQNKIEVTLVEKTSQKFQYIIDIDNFGTSYYVQNNILYKKDANNTINYSNVQLGEITSANAFNPLKINVFYKDFNTAIILDNRLAEIFKIDFNTINPYKSISHIASGNDNTIWIFNQDTRQLELFDYKTNKTRATTLPVQTNILDIASNYNFCWLLTENYLYKYNYFGSLTQKIINDGFTAIEEDNGNLILQKENTLFYLKKNEESVLKIATPELLINQFLVTNESLYIYQFENLTKFQLKNK
jgi:phage antirepressor YoqD-like protein